MDETLSPLPTHSQHAPHDVTQFSAASAYLLTYTRLSAADRTKDQVLGLNVCDMLEMIFPANLLTGAKHPELHIITTNNNIKTETTMQENYVTYAQTKPTETKAWFRGLLCQLVRE